jgi:tetratricopeptide (TPR) repeat protein
MSIETIIGQIGNLEDAVRKHINTHRYQVDLLKDSSNWNQICSSLDVIGDTIYAISSYEAADFPKDNGLQYVYTYGLLQALFLQQDAIRHLSEAFDIKLNLSDKLLDIRGIRNASIGHPTKQNQNGTRFYNHISRISMSKAGFDLMRYSEPRKHDMVNVNISSMVQDQLTEVAIGYKEIASKLAEADKMHKEEFIKELLQDIFPSAMGYFFEKIGQGIWAHSVDDQDFGKSNLRMLKETYIKYQDAIKERNELHEYTEFALSEYFHAIKRLEEYLSSQSSSMDELDARIYLSYLRAEHKGFVELAKEIDEQYQL